MALLSPPLAKYTFTLNACQGVAGIFGGEETLSAMALVLLSHGRRWLGWYNSPGSLFVARHFGHLAQSYSWERMFPHTSKSPATLFGFDGKAGPRYIAAFSGTGMQTGHLGYLAVERCKEILDVTPILGRQTTPADVAVIDVGDVDYDHTVPHLSMFHTFLAIIPIAVSIVTCVMCAVAYDWYSFSAILIGILTSGLANMAIGSLSLVLKSVRRPAPGKPLGDGILVPVISEEIIVVVKGAQSAINAITQGKFGLELRSNGLLEHVIGICSLLLLIEFFVQLVLIPQGTLFGQLMFVISLCVSWAYNFYISSSFRREMLEAALLFRRLGCPRIRKFRLCSRTSMIVFTVLLVCHEATLSSPSQVRRLLHALIPNETFVWTRWRERVTRMVCDQSSIHLDLDVYEGERHEFTEPERVLLRTLLGDARSALDEYMQFHSGAKRD